MCCALLALVLLGPRFFGVLWWLIQPLRWQAAFRTWTGSLWWIWPVLGIILLPWTTLMYIIVAPGGVIGWDWLWIGIMVVADMASYGGGLGRKRLPAYEGY
jgi:hypothetical protein